MTSAKTTSLQEVFATERFGVLNKNTSIHHHLWTVKISSHFLPNPTRGINFRKVCHDSGWMGQLSLCSPNFPSKLKWKKTAYHIQIKSHACLSMHFYGCIFVAGAVRPLQTPAKQCCAETPIMPLSSASSMLSYVHPFISPSFMLKVQHSSSH